MNFIISALSIIQGNLVHSSRRRGQRGHRATPGPAWTFCGSLGHCGSFSLREDTGHPTAATLIFCHFPLALVQLLCKVSQHLFFC
jgi:hypothetical protein